MCATKWNHYLFGGILILACAATGLQAADWRPAVALSQDADTAILANGIVSATVKKANGNLLSLQFHGMELLSRGGGYWNIYCSMPGQKSTELKPSPSIFCVNGRPIGSTGELPESGVMHRDGIRSDTLTERNLKFDAALLKPGENVIELTKHVRTWTDGVLYDYLRLELDSERPFAL